MAKKKTDQEIKEVEKQVEGEAIADPKAESLKVFKSSHPKFSKFSKVKGEK